MKISKGIQPLFVQLDELSLSNTNNSEYEFWREKARYAKKNFIDQCLLVFSVNTLKVFSGCLLHKSYKIVVNISLLIISNLKST